MSKFQEASSRASCLASLARAAQVLERGDGLYDDERSIVVEDIIEAINFLAVDLCKFSRALGDAAERAAA